MRNKHCKSTMLILIIIIPILFSCATTQQKQVELRDAKAYVSRGYFYESKGQYDQAIVDSSKAIEIDPNFEAAYALRALAYARKGQYDRAIADCSKAIEINPRESGNYMFRGVVYGKKGQYDQAISDYTKVLEINPNSAQA